MSNLRAAIYQEVINACPPAALPPGWEGFAACRDARMVPEDASALANVLGDYSNETMLASGICVQRDGALVLHPKLRTEDRYLMLIHNALGQPCDLLSSAGTLSDRVPLFALAEDAGIRRALESAESPCLPVVATMAETVLLRSLGVPAAPVRGLDRLTKPGIQHLMHLVDVFGEGPLRPQRLPHNGLQICHSGLVNPKTLRSFGAVLVAMDVTKVRAGVSANVLAAAQNLARAERYLDFMWDGLSVWEPTPEVLEKLNYRRELGDVELLRDFFRDLEPQIGVADFVDPARRPYGESTYLEVYERLLVTEQEAEFRTSAQFSDFLQQQRDAHRAQLDKHVVAPLFDFALETSDPRLRLVRLQLAHQARDALAELPSLSMQLEKVLSPHHGASSSEAVWKQLATQCKPLERLLKLDHLLSKQTDTQVRGGRGRGPGWPRS